MAHLTKRGTVWHFRMRVPRRFFPVEHRRVIKITLRTDSKEEAEFQAERLRRENIAAWTARLAGGRGAPPSEVPFAQIEAIARERKKAYRPAADIDITELIQRVLQLRSEDPDAEKPELAAALLGAAPKPAFKVSDLVGFYERERRTENAGKDENAMRKWRNPLKLAVSNFIAVAGDMRVAQVSHEEALEFFDWWKDRVAEGEVTDDTANKNLGFLRLMFKAHDKRLRMNRPNPFADLAVSGGTKKSKRRAEFPDAWIRDNLGCSDPLPGMNPEARDLVILCAWTGCRPSEISGVLPAHIHTDAPVPYLDLKNEGRRLKTVHSERPVPLLGRALEAAKRNPQGFPRYRGKATLSDTVNKYLRENDLLPSDAHTLYSLRHAFEGRMTRAGIDNRAAGAMMGHSVKKAIGREHYGDDMTLERRAEIAKMVEP